MKSKRIIIPFQLRKQILKWLYSNHMGIRISILVKYECKYREYCQELYNMHRLPADTNVGKKTILHELPSKLWEIVSADIFSINDNTLLCIVDY